MTVSIALAALLAAAAAAPLSRRRPWRKRTFIERAEKTLEDLNTKDNSPTGRTRPTSSTTRKNWRRRPALLGQTAKLAEEALKYEKLDLPADVRRKILLLKLSVSAPAPKDPQDQKELADIQAWLQGEYGKGKWCRTADKCLTLPDMEDILRDSRDPKELLEVWMGWRTVSPPMRRKYERFVELSNKGARGMGFADTSMLWRSRYDMSPTAFTKELERLWKQLKPPYDSLHAYTRYRLIEKYGKEAIGDDGLIPAHLLGNMRAQSWENIYPLVAPPSSDPGYDLTKILEARKIDEKEMTRMGERFFTSLGFDPLPQTFWERSLFTKPRDREVVCHASAWDVENSQDLRIKMCIKPNAEDFITIHHELGQQLLSAPYAAQPFLFRGSAITTGSMRPWATPSRSRSRRSTPSRSALRQGPRDRGGPGTADEDGPGARGLPALRADGGPVALEGLLRRGQAGRLQQGLVGPGRQVPRRQAARRAQ